MENYMDSGLVLGAYRDDYECCGPRFLYLSGIEYLKQPKHDIAKY